jgi:hypothetical protein
MQHFAKSNAVRNPRTVTFACLAAACAMAACGNSDPAPAPAVSQGGAPGNGGATQAQTGGATQTSTGGATQTSTGGATQAQTGGATQTSTGGAVTDAGGSTAGGATQTSTGGAATDAGGSTAGGASASGGTAGAAGATDPCAPKSCASTADCTAAAPTQALLTDFSSNSGDFKGTATEWWTKLFGGTYLYPALDACATTQPANPLTQDFSDGTWHITGTVGNYSGFGLWFSPCMADFSAYKGISFKISGNVGTTAAVVMTVSTAATSKKDATTCSPNTATCVDGDTDATKCAPASKSIPVTSTATTVTVLWTDLTGGVPVASPSAASIVGIGWALDWLWSNTATNNYAVDFVIDDITLVQ